MASPTYGLGTTPNHRPRSRSATGRIARIAGIDVEVNWTWIIAFALITTSLAGSAFPAAVPGLSHAAYVLMGAIASIAFFGSIVAHEFGHAMQARREGLTTDRVTLWMFGGIAQLREGFRSAGAEFRIAIAGPLVTLVIVGLLLALGQVPALPAAVAAVVIWLAYINAILLGFNLLPALPLDGGRVLRSALWGMRHDFVSATRSAVAVSRVLAVAMIAFGLLGGYVTGIGGLWLAFVGGFILLAGSAEQRAAGG